MKINTLFSPNDTCLQVFDTLAALAKSNRQLLLVYREGRRTDDDFVKKPLKIDSLLFERVKYSNEWQILTGPENCQQASVVLRFSDNQLVSISSANGECSLFIPYALVMTCWLNKVSTLIRRVVFTRLPWNKENITANQKSQIYNKRFDER